MLIARLAAIGFEGFEETQNVLKAFIPYESFDEIKLMEITDACKCEFTKAVIHPQNWNEAWETSFDPVIISDFCAIRAEFHKHVPFTAHEIIITPKMSFGTGHHATTYLMIACMRGIGFYGKSVCDFGTGTGVLAILAEKIGAASIHAFDNDEWSIENGKENIGTNHCQRISLLKADHLSGRNYFDIILANINRNVILANLAAMKRQVVPGGTILISGFLVGDEEDMVNAALDVGLNVTRRSEKNSWLCLQLMKPS